MTREPLIINLALTGMVPTKRLTPHVPLTPVDPCRALIREPIRA